MFVITNIVVILFLTSVINAFAAYISWQRRKTNSGWYFALGMLGVTLWTLTAALDYAAVSIPWKVFFAKWEYAGYSVAFAFFALFALSHAGYQHWLEKTPVRMFFTVIPVSNILLAWTNDWHGWLWSGFVRSTFGDNTVIFEHGPGYLWAVMTGYLMILIIIVPLWQSSRVGSQFSRRQSRLLFFASLIPILGNLFYLFQAFEFRGVDWTPLTFSISGLLFVLALHGPRLLDIVPIARDNLVAGLSDGIVVLDMDQSIIDVNQSAADMFQVPMERLIGKKVVEVAPLAQTLPEGSIDQEVRTELEIGDTQKRYFDVLVSPLRENRKVVVGRLIILRDITIRKENELRLLQLTQAVEQSPVSVLIANLEGKIDYVNPRFVSLSGYSREELIGKNPNIIQSGQTPIETYQDMWQTIRSGHVWRGELLNRKKNGDLYWELEVVAPVFDNAGHIINFIAVKEDITSRKEAEVKLLNAYAQLEEKMRQIQELQIVLHEHSIRDSLTGLHNRYYLEETLGRELARAEREGYRVCFALIDIDRFKDVNDTYGHSAGDLVLQQLAHQLQTLTRTGDIVCRYGGEEFLIVLPNTHVDIAFQIAERIRSAFQELSISSGDRQIKATLSVGISEFPSDSAVGMETLDLADRALYAAKHGGRNQVVLWSGTGDDKPVA